MLLSCLACIYMVFFFGRRLQTSAYLRESSIEGAKQQELKILLRDIKDKALAGPLDPANPPPDGYGSTARLWDRERYGISEGPSAYYRGLDETQEQKEERLRQEAEEERRETAFRNWEKEERIRYENICGSAELEATKRAKRRVPASIDISLLGGGFAFLLEFSTVIVIIFTLMILGVLTILEGKDIATILAAIAGYVLGKASSAASSAKVGSEPQK